MIKKDVLYIADGVPVTIVHKELGTWKDATEGVITVHDMDTLLLRGGKQLDMDDYGIFWWLEKDVEQE